MILVTMSRRMKALEETWQALMMSQMLKSSHGMGCWLKMRMMSLCIALSSSSAHQLICRKKNCAFYIQKPWPRPSQARAKPSFMALAWPRVWESQTHLRPSQSQGFQAKPGQNSTRAIWKIYWQYIFHRNGMLWLTIISQYITSCYKDIYGFLSCFYMCKLLYADMYSSINNNHNSAN